MAPSSERTTGGPCRGCVRIISWIPVLFIVSIVGWSYYAYVIQLCIFYVNSFFEKILYLIGYHFFLMMFVWAYWQTVFTPIGTVPRKFKLSKQDLDKLKTAENEEMHRTILERVASKQNLPVTNRTDTGSIRYCEKCRQIKPDRAHHCSVCGQCVLKMDHHCPWINNCVSFTNYKFFLLFLAYALIYCLFIVLTSLQYFIQFWRGEMASMGRFHILFLFFVAAMFAISMFSLFSYHCYLVIRNISTLEAFRAPIFRTGEDRDGFSLGKYNNFQEIFGDYKACWFIPVFTSLGDGVVYPVRSQHQVHQYDSIGVTHNSFGDGITFPQRLVDEDTDTLLGGRQRWAEEDSPSHQVNPIFIRDPAPV